MTEYMPDPDSFSLGGRQERWLEGKPPRHRPREKFLKGPIPRPWLVRAARLPGKSLHVAVGLWFWAGIRRTDTVKLSTAFMETLGVGRHSVYRALRVLEAVGLITVERHAGRLPVVTLLSVPEKSGSG